MMGGWSRHLLTSVSCDFAMRRRRDLSIEGCLTWNGGEGGGRSMVQNDNKRAPVAAVARSRR
eukprot:1442329-Prymnesium_polylepis.1